MKNLRLRSVVLVSVAVLAASTDAAPPRLPGMKDILAATKKPVQTVTLAELGGVPASAGTVTVKGTTRPDLKVRKQQLIDTKDPAAAAAELVAALRGDGAL